MAAWLTCEVKGQATSDFLPPSLPPSLFGPCQVKANKELVEKSVSLQKENHKLKEDVRRLSDMIREREEEYNQILARAEFDRALSPPLSSSSTYALTALPPIPSSSPPLPPVVASPEKRRQG